MDCTPSIRNELKRLFWPWAETANSTCVVFSVRERRESSTARSCTSCRTVGTSPTSSVLNVVPVLILAVSKVVSLVSVTTTASIFTTSEDTMKLMVCSWPALRLMSFSDCGWNSLASTETV